MKPISAVPASMSVEVGETITTTPIEQVRDGQLLTFADGSQWFTWQLIRGRSFSVRIAA